MAKAMTAGRLEATREDELRHDVVECPICGEPTMPNVLPDGSRVCSCPAERAVSLPGDAGPALPPLVDDTSFVAPAHGASTGLPAFKGQFGRDIQTDDFRPMDGPRASDRGAADDLGAHQPGGGSPFQWGGRPMPKR